MNTYAGLAWPTGTGLPRAPATTCVGTGTSVVGGKSSASTVTAEDGGDQAVVGVVGAVPPSVSTAISTGTVSLMSGVTCGTVFVVPPVLVAVDANLCGAPAPARTVTVMLSRSELAVTPSDRKTLIASVEPAVLLSAANSHTWEA